ncbi:Transcription regulator HTH, GntR [Moorella glycerini]|uniref:HTH-type transcriptional regulator McbR n=1 Tax=Neomoorella stamsii TaxID=1266720 RepID=A0A9X7P6J4_9FIRM|nr:MULTISPECIES: GntR family transcriptional regulator [Moorella]PRR73568.1 HTH-type transcriptional regulator McbR [Moorella stamsii]CEP69337.1 Transcription regulator HTH, GntR [Moorella glycerini]
MSSLTTPLQWKTKTEMIYNMLREAIVSGELKPGERIVLRKIASDLGVSAIPVREAIKQLEAEGLVDVSAHSEVTVSRLSEKDFRELSSIRVVLEAYATRLTAERITPEILAELEQQIKEMEACVRNDDYRRYGILNRRFHQTIYTHCGNEQLKKIIDDLTVRTDRARALFAYNRTRFKESLKEHRAIVEAMAKGQPEIAEKVMAEQKRIALEMFLKYSKGTPPFEDGDQ